MAPPSSSQAALAALLLLCSTCSVSAQFAVSTTYATSSGLSVAAQNCFSAGGSALFSSAGARSVLLLPHPFLFVRGSIYLTTAAATRSSRC
jgi:hypothetical protein